MILSLLGITASILLSYLAVRLLAPGAEESVWGSQQPLTLLHKAGLTGAVNPLRFLEWLSKGRYETLTIGVITWKTPLQLTLYTITPILIGSLAGFTAALIVYSLNAGRRASTILGVMPGFFYAILYASAAGLISSGTGFASTFTIYVLTTASIVAGRVLLQAYSGEENTPLIHYYLAMGMPPWKARLKNARARLPMLSAVAVSTAAIISSRSFILESIIGYPGLGYLLAQSILGGDPLLAGALLAYEAALMGSLQAIGHLIAARM